DLAGFRFAGAQDLGIRRGDRRGRLLPRAGPAAAIAGGFRSDDPRGRAKHCRLHPARRAVHHRLSRDVNDLPKSTGADATAMVEMNEVAVGADHRSGRPSVEGVTWTVRSGDYWVVGGSAE